MATIYRIVIEQNIKTTEDGRKGGNRLGTGKKQTAKTPNFLVGSRGGVEHNRKLRAINPLLNKATGGYWEKGMRLGRAGMGVANAYNNSGMKGVLGSVGLVIIVQMVLVALIKWQTKERQKAEQLNAQNFKQLENGIGSVRSSYEINSNFWTGRQTYNQNK